VMATGHYRNGVLLAPATADEVVRLLDRPDDVVRLLDRPDDGSVAGAGPFDAFRPSRFARAGGRG